MRKPWALGIEIQQKRCEEDPQDNCEGGVQETELRKDSRSEGIKKDLINMKLMVYVCIILTENILSFKNIQIFWVSRQYVRTIRLI